MFSNIKMYIFLGFPSNIKRHPISAYTSSASVSSRVSEHCISLIKNYIKKKQLKNASRKVQNNVIIKKCRARVLLINFDKVPHAF